MSLSEDEIEAIRLEASRYEAGSAAAIDALKLVQRRRGWVSNDDVAEIAALLDMPPAELGGIATFYNLIYLRPVGRKVIHYCNSVCCWMLGAEQNRRHIEERLQIGLGETTADGEYTLLPIVCLGACDKAPVMMIGDETHMNVDRAAIDHIVPPSGGS